MSLAGITSSRDLGRPVAAWGGVYAMSLCTFVLIASEFMPVSLLSPIAATLDLTQGQAGQAIAISGIFAVLTSLSIAKLAGGIDRRRLLLGLTALMILSGTMVAFAPGYPILMIGRALLGIVIGGFWSISAATIMRLVPADSVPRGLAILNGGNAIATTIAAPLGSYVGGLVGWRGAFFCIVPVALAALVWQAISLPPLPDARSAAKRSIVDLLRRPMVWTGMVALLLLFAGQFTLFTYLRPFLEQVTHVGLPLLSTLLLVIGFAGLVGTVLIGRVLGLGLDFSLIAMPAVLALLALGLALFGGLTWVVALLLFGWGLIGTSAPVAWWTWLSQRLPEDAEVGGGLMVAVIQLAITIGATLGGIVFDRAGPVSAFLASAAILLLAALAAALGAGLHRKAIGR